MGKNNMNTPILETERLTLRPFQADDAVHVFECWEIGYNLGKAYWGKGYATEAMVKVIDFAREQLNITQIVGRYAKENSASGNVMSKLGFKYEKDIPYECNDGAVKREGIQCRVIFATNKNIWERYNEDRKISST